MPPHPKAAPCTQTTLRHTQPSPSAPDVSSALSILVVGTIRFHRVDLLHVNANGVGCSVSGLTWHRWYARRDIRRARGRGQLRGGPWHARGHHRPHVGREGHETSRAVHLRAEGTVKEARRGEIVSHRGGPHREVVVGTRVEAATRVKGGSVRVVEVGELDGTVAGREVVVDVVVPMEAAVGHVGRAAVVHGVVQLL